MKRKTLIGFNIFGLIINSLLLIFKISILFTSKSSGSIGIVGEDYSPVAIFLSLNSIYSATFIIPIFILLIIEIVFILNIKFAKKTK